MMYTLNILFINYTTIKLEKRDSWIEISKLDQTIQINNEHIQVGLPK